MRLKINESQTMTQRKTELYSTLEDLIAQAGGLPDSINSEVFGGKYNQMSPEAAYNVPFPVLVKAIDMMKDHVNNYAEMESLTESKTAPGKYVVNSDAQVDDLIKFFDKVFEYEITSVDPDIICPINSDVNINSNGTIDLRGECSPKGTDSGKCVVTLTLEQFARGYVIEFFEDVSPEDLSELFDEVK